MTTEQLAAKILAQTQERLRTMYPTSDQWEWERVQVVPGPKYTKIDRGPAHNMSGFLMIENATGVIYGIKGYGRVHKGHRYGTLDTAGQWFWGNYGPMKVVTDEGKRQPVDPELFGRTAPNWNCVDYPDEGMHYTPDRGGVCRWCGMDPVAIAREYSQRESQHDGPCGNCGCGTPAVQVRRDGKVMAEVEDSNAAFAWLLRNQGQSVDWAIKHEGWSVTDASGTELPEYKTS